MSKFWFRVRLISLLAVALAGNTYALQAAGAAPPVTKAPAMPAAAPAAEPTAAAPTAAEPDAAAPAPDGPPADPPPAQQPALQPPAPAAVPPPPPPPAPQPTALALPPMDDVLGPVKQAVATLEAIEQRVETIKTSETGLAQQRLELEALLAANGKAADQLRPRINETRVQLDKLGPAPKEDQTEAPEIAAERARLTAVATALDGALRSADLVNVRAAQLMARVQEMRHRLFASNLFERTGSPLSPGIWNQITTGAPAAATQLQAVFGTWQGIIARQFNAALTVLGSAIASFLLLWLLIRRPLARLMPHDLAHSPSYTARAAAATLAAPMYALPAAAAIAILYFGAGAADLIYSRVAALAEDLFQGAMLVTVVTALARAILEPRRPDWRLMNLSDGAARSLLRSVVAIALVYAVDQVLLGIIRLLVLPLPFSVALAFITSLAFAGLLINVVLTPFVPAARAASLEMGDARAASLEMSDARAASLETSAAPAANSEKTAERAASLDLGDAGADAATGPLTPPPLPQPLSRYTPRWLKLPLLLVAVAIVAAALVGYVALSRFAAGQVVITGSAAVLVALLHLAIRTTERAIVSPATLAGSWLERSLNVADTQRQWIGRVVSVVLHTLLALVAIPGLLLAWGFSLDDVLTGLKSVIFGFQIGGLKISLARILLALGLFAGLLFATRLIQRGLRAGMLRSGTMDPGIANSIDMGVGYAGFSLATLIGVSFAGIDITNLAILAGALSVGIGFGLQSIVNNFVSGLILLVERPIKVGDWIVLRGGGEGYVRSISVRSTEIETFDRSSLIVPNSELISNVVTNWTHRNALGRIVVKVAAAYKSDPEHVMRVLTAVAKSSPLVMQQPAPLITLDNLGADGLEFSIRVVVADITKALPVQTQIRSAVVSAFREYGIDFPTSSRDIYLRDLDGVKVLIARVLEERARNGQAPVAAPGEKPS